LVYIAQGAAGLPFFAKGAAGLAYLRGVTGGYLIGFVIAAFSIGWLVERGVGRKYHTAVLAMCWGNAIIYGFGVLWLQNILQTSLSTALKLGVYPFMLGDVYKIGIASVLLPVLWKFFNEKKGY
ncbi:biotin transporter BioY, partial [candidate division KSB3 bacterium]|nr:biotin transporter BioY [candidate division KSB3 bacterium]MBD3324872.1 biotin transporter BioY [candidate division KSB3 bacterium]